MLKKTLTAIAVIAIVLVVAAVALIAFVDVNRFKPQIESYVKSNYDRTLSIGGDLSLKFFPRIAIALPATSLSEPKSDSSALSLESARVSVAVMPLLSGQIQADKITLNGLRASLTRRKDGTTSIDDLIGASDGQAAASESGGSSSAVSQVRIGGIELQDATIDFRDEAAGNEIKLSNVNLTTGELRDNLQTPLALSADVAMSNPVLAARIELQSEVQFALQAATYAAPNAALSIRGQLDGMPIDQKLELTELRGDATALSVAEIAVTSQIEQPERKLAATIKTPLAYQVEGGVLKLAQIAGQIDLTDAAISAEPLAIALSGKADANLDSQRAAAQLTIDAPDAAMTVDMQVRGFDKPAIKFSLSSDKINLDRYLPPASDAEPSPADGKAAGAPADVPEAEIDLTALNDLALDGTIKIGHLIAQGLTATNVNVAVKSGGGQIKLDPVKVDLYGGAMRAASTVRTKDNRLSLNADLTAVNIGPLIKDLTQDELIEGNGDVALRVQSAGPTVSAIKRALAGSARVELRDGAIIGINLGQKIRDARQMLRAGSAESTASDAGLKTDFAALSASFKIANGVANNDDLMGKSPLLRLGGAGKIDIAGGQLDYTARASLVGTSKGQGGKDAAELRGVTIPVVLTGPFEALQWKIDWASAAKAALKSRAAEKLSGKLAPKKAELKAKADARKAELETKKDAKVNELKDKAARKLGDKFKGLLGN